MANDLSENHGVQVINLWLSVVRASHCENNAYASLAFISLNIISKYVTSGEEIFRKGQKPRRPRIEPTINYKQGSYVTLIPDNDHYSDSGPTPASIIAYRSTLRQTNYLNIHCFLPSHTRRIQNHHGVNFKDTRFIARK